MRPRILYPQTSTSVQRDEVDAIRASASAGNRGQAMRRITSGRSRHAAPAPDPKEAIWQNRHFEAIEPTRRLGRRGQKARRSGLSSGMSASFAAGRRPPRSEMDAPIARTSPRQ